MSFIARKDFRAGTHPRAVIGDFNGDGKLDLAVVNRGLAPFSVGTVSVLLGNGDGTFRVGGGFGAGVSCASIVVGDNGDGKMDLAVANSGSNNVLLLLGDGDGTFQEARSFPCTPWCCVGFVNLERVAVNCPGFSSSEDRHNLSS